MRLSAYVRLHGIAPFSFDDFIFVGSKVSTDPSKLILVGGQALEVWGHFLHVPQPTGQTSPLTEDVDWLGSRKDAQWLIELLGEESTELVTHPHADGDVNTAIAWLKRPDGRVLRMDFLRCIVGPDTAEVRRLAVPIAVDGVQLHVMHPLLCLRSRLANIAVLPSKRAGNGFLQAEWAIDIVQAFLKKLAGAPSRQLIRACHQVAEMAEYDYGRKCFVEFGIDPLRAVSNDVVRAVGARFEADDWPRTIARIERRRAKWAELKARSSQPADGG